MSGKIRIVYLRTSTEDQNPENQLKDCLTMFEGEYEKYLEQQSAWKDKDRPLFEEVKKKIKTQKVSDLYVWDWDRLFRNRKKLIDFFKFCEIYNCKIHSFRQLYFEDFYKIPAPFDEIVSNLILNLMGHMAEEESKKKSERVKLAIRKNDGVTKSYKGNKWGRKSLSKKVKEEIHKHKQMGQSIREIADSVFYWDKNGNRKPVSRSAVHKTLQEVNL